MTPEQQSELEALKAALKRHIEEEKNISPGPWIWSNSDILSKHALSQVDEWVRRNYEGYRPNPEVAHCRRDTDNVHFNAPFIARARTMSPMACRIALEGIMSLEFIARTDCSCETYNIAEKRLLNIMYLWKGGQL